MIYCPVVPVRYLVCNTGTALNPEMARFKQEIAFCLVKFSIFWGDGVGSGSRVKYLVQLLLSVSGAYSICGLSVCLPVCLDVCVSSDCFKSLLLQFSSDSHETWNTSYVPIRKKLWNRFSKY